MNTYNKKVKCPFCNYKGTKEQVIHHIEIKHDDYIPEGYTATRVLFNELHHKTHGTCVICHRETEWNEERGKYNRLCGRKECKEALRDQYKKNMLKVYGTYNILNNDKQQKKMLAGRHISGIYKFQNGTSKEYTGSYEKNMLEFLDKVLNFNPDDIMMPGPTIDYVYKGTHHQWITDALIIPYNLIIEVKDGGSNPNNRPMASYREKQVAKETMLTNMGTYNYVRLVNNQFEQLLEIMYELKMQLMDDRDITKKAIIRIHEDGSILESKTNKSAFTDLALETIKSSMENARSQLHKFIKVNKLQGLFGDPSNVPYDKGNPYTRKIYGGVSRLPGEMDNKYSYMDIDISYKPDKAYLIYPYNNGRYNLPLLAVSDYIPLFNSKNEALYAAIYLCSNGKSKVLSPKEGKLIIDKDWWNSHKDDMFYFIKATDFNWENGNASIDATKSNGILKNSYITKIIRLNRIVVDKVGTSKVRLGKW